MSRERQRSTHLDNSQSHSETLNLRHLLRKTFIVLKPLIRSIVSNKPVGVVMVLVLLAEREPGRIGGPYKL